MMLFDSLIKKFGASSLNGGDVNSFAEYLRKVGVARQAIAVKTGVAQSVKSDTQGSQAGMRPQPNQLPRSDATSVSNRVEQVKVSAPVDNAKLPEAQVQSIVRGIKSGEVRGIRQEHMAQVVEAFISSLQNEVSMLRSVNASNEAVRTKANEMRANVTDVKDVIARSLLAPATIESYIGKFNDIERVLKEIVAANQEMSAVRRQLTSRELVAVNELIKNQEWDKIDPNDFLACVDRFINDLQRDEEAPVLFTDVPSLVYLDRAATLMQSYPPLAQSVLDQARTAMTYYMRYQSLIFSFKNNPTFTQRMVEAGSRMRPLYDRLLTIELSAAKFARER